MKLSMLAAGGVVGVLVVMTGCGSADDDLPTNAVAKVGDTTISSAAFREQLASAVRGESQGGKPIVYVPPDFDRCVAAKDKQDAAPEGQKDKGEEDLRKECEQDYQRLRTQTMEFLIQREWVRRAADKVGIEVTHAQARKEFERQKDQAFKTAKAYKEFLLSSGRSEANILEEVETTLRQQKLSEKVTEGKTGVSAAEVRRYYAKNKEKLGKPERRSLRIVLAKSEGRAGEAKQALDSGESWPAVAKEYSIDKASATKGGLLPEVTETGDKKVDAALKSAQVGTITGPMKTQFGWWVFEVEKVIPPTVPPLESVRAQIKGTLEQQKQQKALDEFAASFREEYRGKTVCAEDFKVASCENGPEKNPTTPASSMQQPQSRQDS